MSSATSLIALRTSPLMSPLPLLIIISMPAVMMSMLPLLALIILAPTNNLQQLLSAYRIIHNLLISRLLLSLNRKHRVLPNLRRHISRSIRILQRHETLLPRRLTKRLLLIPLNQPIDPSLSKQIALQLFSRAIRPRTWALVHPIHAIYSFARARGLELGLDLLLGSFFLEFFDAKFGLFALFERALLGLPYFLLVGEEDGMPGLFEVEVAAHCGGCVGLKCACGLEQ